MRGFRKIVMFILMTLLFLKDLRLHVWFLRHYYLQMLLQREQLLLGLLLLVIHQVIMIFIGALLILHQQVQQRHQRDVKERQPYRRTDLDQYDSAFQCSDVDAFLHQNHLHRYR